MLDESFDIAIRLHVVYVEYVKFHFPHVTDGWAGIPNTGRSCETDYGVSVRTACTVDFLQRSGNREVVWRDTPQGAWVITSDHLHK